MRKRKFPEHNYFAIFDGITTTRFQIEDEKPITELDHPEFFDIKITDYCRGNCPWCYQDSKAEGKHVEKVPFLLANYFGNMDLDIRPFQVAFGGGNPNENPDFPVILKNLWELGIIPNYTTNGMGIDEVLEDTKKYCGGVAVSTHPHLEKHWEYAVNRLTAEGVKTNLHILISDYESMKYFLKVYVEYREKIRYFVLLPYTVMGRAEEKEIDYEMLEYILNTLKHIYGDIKDIAFGAGFFEFLKDKDWGVSLYDPEIFSKYMDLSTKKIYKSSFDLTEIGEI